MPGRTLAQLRRGTGRLLGLKYWSGTANATGGTTTNIRDSDTRSFPTGHFSAHFAIVTSGTDSGALKFVSNFTNTNGDFTVTPAGSASTVHDSVTFEVYPFHPALMTDAINDAITRLYPFVGRSVSDESFVVNSPLWNPGFEDWTSSSAAVGYTVSTSTLAREAGAANVLTGQYSATLTGSAGFLGLSTAHVRAALSRLNGYSITLYAFVKSDTGSDARLRIVDSDGNTTGSYHTGNSQFQLLSAGPRTMRSTDPANADAYDVRLLKDSGASVSYIDRWWIEGGPITETYRTPGTMPRGPSSVYVTNIVDREHFRHDGWRHISFETVVHEDENATTGYTDIIIPRRVATYTQAMMLVGRDTPTALSAETDTVECDEITGALIQAEAAILLFHQVLGAAGVPLAGGGQRPSNTELLWQNLLRHRDELMRRLRERGEPVTLAADI